MRSGHYRILVALLLVLSIVFAVAGCKNDNKKGAEKTDVPEVTAAPEETPTENGDSGTEAPETELPSTEAPTGVSTEEPTAVTTETPTDEPTQEPTAEPTPTPTPTPTPKPTEKPTAKPTSEPTAKPGAKLSDYDGIVISRVYGNGGNNDAVCEYSFIELYNTSSKAINMDGLSVYYKTAGSSEYKQYALGNVSMKPGTFYLIRCAKAGTSAKPFVTSGEVIKINKYDATWDVTLDNKEVGIVLALTGKKPDVKTKVPELKDTVSYFSASETFYFDNGCVDDLSKNKVAVRTELQKDSAFYTVNLTKANSSKLAQIVPKASSGANTVVKSMLQEVVFSKPAGFYDSDFSLTLTAPSGYTIYYTTDGSNPKTSSTKVKYTGPISVKDSSSINVLASGTTTMYLMSNYSQSTKPAKNNLPGGRVIRAYATNNSKTTPIYTNTYFVSPEFAKYNATVMSVSIDKNQLVGSTTGFWNHYYASTNDPNMRGTAMMEVFDENGERRGYSNIELSISGHGSSGWNMKSMKLYIKGDQNTEGGLESNLYYDIFDGYSKNSKGQTITKFSRLLLRNSGNDCSMTYIRDAFMQRVSKDLRLDTMAYTPVILFFNGELWGTYNLRERYSGDYFEDHYGVNSDNVTIAESDYSQVHTDCNAPYVLTSGLDKDVNDFNTLVAYIKGHNLSVESNYKYVTDRLDEDSLIDLFVIRLYFNALDFPENNIKVWKNRDANDPSGFDTKWHFTLLDTDFGCGYYDQYGVSYNTFGWLDNTGSVLANIIRGMLRNEGFKKKFMMRAYEVYADIYDVDWMLSVLDDIVEERKPIFQLLLDRWPGDGGSWNKYNSGINIMKSYLKSRRTYAISQLCSWFGVTEASLRGTLGSYAQVSFDPATSELSVDGAAVNESWKQKFEGTKTFSVTARAKSGYEVTGISYITADGKSTRKTGSSASFSVNMSGTFYVETRKISSGTAVSITPGITAAGYTMYYLNEKGQLYGWGTNASNLLGNTPFYSANVPVFLRDNVAKVETGHSNDCENTNSSASTAILTTDGVVYTVGGSSGALGRTTDPLTWGKIDFTGKVVDVSVGYDHILILDADGNLWGMGNNSYGQLGSANYGGTADKFQKVASNVKLISAGRRNTLYVDNNGDCFALGDGRWNKLCTGTDNAVSPLKLLSDVKYIASGEHQMLMITTDGKLYYAGWRTVNGFGQGEGSHGAKEIKCDEKLVKATIHFGNLIALSESGKIYAYGINTAGALGQSITDGTAKLIKNDVFTDIATGYGFIACLKADGTVLVQGDTAYEIVQNPTNKGTVSIKTP